MDWTTEKTWFDPRRVERGFLCSKVSIPAQKPPQHRVHWIRRGSFPAGKATEPRSRLSSSADVKKMWSCAYTPSSLSHMFLTFAGTSFRKNSRSLNITLSNTKLFFHVYIFQYRGVQILQGCRSHLNTLGTKMVTRRKFDIEDPLILDTAIQTSFLLTNWRPGFVQLCLVFWKV